MSLLKSQAVQFYFGTLISSVGNMTFTISILGFMLQEGFSLFQASLIIGASRLVPILISTFLGDKADELSPRKTVVLTEFGAALCSVGVLWAWDHGTTAYWYIASFAVARSVLLSFQSGSKAKVSKELGDATYSSQSKQAIWLNKATQGATLFAGVLGWAAIKFVNFETVVIFDAVTFIINGVILYRLSVKESSTQPGPITSVLSKFKNLYSYNKKAATLDLLLAVSSLGYSSFLARLAGTNEALIPLLMLAYGLGVWIAGYLEGWVKFKNNSLLLWLSMAITFVLLGQYAGLGPIVWVILLIKETAFWTIYHRVSAHIQSDTPKEIFGSVTHARYAQYAATIAVGEFLVGAWAKTMPVEVDALWRGVLCLSIVAYSFLTNKKLEQAHDRPAL